MTSIRARLAITMAAFGGLLAASLLIAPLLGSTPISLSRAFDGRLPFADNVELADDCFLHPALFTDDLDAQIQGHKVLWGPEIVEGHFGRRRIVFVEAPGGIRLEFMEQLEPSPDPAQEPSSA